MEFQSHFFCNLSDSVVGFRIMSSIEHETNNALLFMSITFVLVSLSVVLPGPSIPAHIGTIMADWAMSLFITGSDK